MAALPCALSLGALLAHFPGAARWERLGADARSPGAPPEPGAALGGGPPSPLVRGEAPGRGPRAARPAC